MYLTSTLRRALIIGGVALLAVVGLIGWTTHRPATPVAASEPALGYGTPSANPEPVAAPDTYATAPANQAYAPANAYGETVTSYAGGNSAYGRGAVYAQSPFAADGGYGYVAPPPAPIAPPPSAYVSTAPPERVVVERRYVYRGGRRYVVVHRRDHHLRHELEVVGGTAAVGAGIGALAGGGKGAGIGALAGGGAGYLYEKLHK